ncbi:Hypothetical predicted protein [Octopus vulgaris]|uniref:Uncharacterized protein n=1 Tax=Octopus vulgaris TaxID=6645 RepID=A0AA36FID4_OCTVU|nr:Hypothetical predicted protein [Octopus vulgaris]
MSLSSVGKFLLQSELAKKEKEKWTFQIRITAYYLVIAISHAMNTEAKELSDLQRCGQIKEIHFICKPAYIEASSVCLTHLLIHKDLKTALRLKNSAFETPV